MPLQHIKCSIKANEGLLYPLKSSLMFLHKPTLYIKHSSIKYIELFRLKGASTKSFDMGVKTKEGSEWLFTNIEMGELKGVVGYYKAVKIKVREGDVEGDMASGGEISEGDIENITGGRGRRRI